jgi:hypothetical protein
MKRLILAACAAGTVATLAGCGGGSTANASGDSNTVSHDLTVSFQLTDSNRESSCSTGGGGGYSDINANTPVVVRDGQQNVLTTVPLGSDCQLLIPGDQTSNNMGGLWTTHVKVATGKGPYSIEVGHRGAMTFTEDQLQQKGWEAQLHLGD